MNKNTGAAKPATGKLAGGLLASGPFYHTDRPHPIEAMNAKTIRNDRMQEMRETAIFWLKIAALCIATLAAMQIANKAMAKVTYQIHNAQQEVIR